MLIIFANYNVKKKKRKVIHSGLHRNMKNLPLLEPGRE